MKRLICAIVAIALLTACTGNRQDSLNKDEVAMQQNSANRKKPRIPKKPSTTASKTMQANLLGSSDLQQEKTVEPNIDIDQLVERINETLGNINITLEDIERGWYYGEELDKRVGTPSSWEWVDEGRSSYWYSPDAIEEADDIKADVLCRKTGGSYVISCIEREVTNCEYVAESECRCSMESNWVEDQGCILLDEEGEFAEISTEELKRGWYFGSSNEKKLNTPASWIWMENGTKSRWKNPSPIR